MKKHLRTMNLLRATVIAASALLLFAATGNAQERWQIVRAQYGTGSRWADVTRRVQSLVRGDTLDFRVNNDTMGSDPAPDHKKFLRMQVRDVRAQIHQLTFPENEMVHLAVGSGYGIGSHGLRITSARYGADSRMADVTSRLEGMVRGDRISVRVDNNAMGGDPADDRKKHLDISYIYDGQPGQITVIEGGTLTLPEAGGSGVSVYGTLSILRAEYGAGQGVWDVTSHLNSQIQSNNLSIRVTNDSMGGDPAHDIPKRLDVWYLYNNRAGHVAVNEKDLLTLPTVGDANYFQNGLQITRAQYGADSRFADVTALLSSRVQGDRLNLRVTNDAMGGDPAHDERKVLTVFYIYNGRPGRVFANENDVLVLPVGTTTVRGDRDDDDDNYYRRFWPGRSASELRVLQASWGAGGQQRDVTGQLNQQVQGNRLNVNVNDGSMGGDPAPGAEKRLRVVYMFRGLRYETNVPEGGVLALP